MELRNDVAWERLENAGNLNSGVSRSMTIHSCSTWNSNVRFVYISAILPATVNSHPGTHPIKV